MAWLKVDLLQYRQGQLQLPSDHMRWYFKIVLVLFLLYAIYTIIHVFFFGDYLAFLFVLLLIGIGIFMFWLEYNGMLTDDEYWEIR